MGDVIQRNNLQQLECNTVCSNWRQLSRQRGQYSGEPRLTPQQTMNHESSSSTSMRRVVMSNSFVIVGCPSLRFVFPCNNSEARRLWDSWFIVQQLNLSWYLHWNLRISRPLKLNFDFRKQSLGKNISFGSFVRYRILHSSTTRILKFAGLPAHIDPLPIFMIPLLPTHKGFLVTDSYLPYLNQFSQLSLRCFLWQ